MEKGCRNNRICPPKRFSWPKVQNRAGVEGAGVWSWPGELSPVLRLMDQVTFLHKLDRVLDTSFYRLNEDTSLDFQKNHVNSVMKCVMVQCVQKLIYLPRGWRSLANLNFWYTRWHTQVPGRYYLDQVNTICWFQYVDYIMCDYCRIINSEVDLSISRI